jgi:ribosome recycling factor
MLEKLINDSTQRMEKTVEALKTDFSKMRSGRAHPSLIEHIMVSYYGSEMPLKQVANITVEDSRTLGITPFDKSMFPVIEKAIMTADLGLNPATSGTIIRIPLPAMTEARRKEMIKMLKHEAEQGRVSIRNVRRDANAAVKELLKSKELTEDDEKRAEERIQKLTDKFIAEIETALAKKEKDLMEI